MTKMRVHELAKELGLESKELVDILNKKKVEIKGHMSTVEDEVAAAIRKEFAKKSAEGTAQVKKDGKEAVQAEKGAPGVQGEKKSGDGAEKAQNAVNGNTKEEKKNAAEGAPNQEKKSAAEGVPNLEKKGAAEGTPNPEKKPATEASANGEAAAEAAPKKKTIMQVFRPQNSKSASRMQGGRPGNKPQGQRGAKQGQPQKSQENGQNARRSDRGGRKNSRNSDSRQGKAQVMESRPRIQVSVQTTAQKEASMRQQEMERMEAERKAREAAAREAQAAAAEKAEQASRVEASQNVEQADARDRRHAERAQSQEGGNRGERAGFGERSDRGGRSERGQNAERSDRGGRTERVQNGERGERRQGGDRQTRTDRGYGERSDRGQGGNRGGYQGGDRQNRGERFQDGDRQGRGERFQNGQGGRSQGADRDARGAGRGGARPFNRDERSDRQERGGRGGFGDRAQGRAGGRRDDRDSISAPMVEQQKSQRSKGKDKEKDYKKRELRDAEFENKGKKGKLGKPVAEVKKPQPKKVEVEEIKQIVLPEVLTIKELADKMKIVPSVIIKKLFLQGKIVTVNQEIDYDTAEEIAMEFDILCEKEEVVDVIEELLKEEEEDEAAMEKRPPVVCVMGHVDHGKTSLLDAIRHTNVIGREAGGITQHIGAYVVEVNGERITFLDTPGHEAFTAMRMRGANATDIAILVVAADDGVMPQTVEAINHAKAAGVEIIVAVNKIDKPSANVDRVKQEMTEYGLIAEDWGGSTVFVPVSAHTGEGIQDLLEMILLTSEVMELKANPNRSARGLVIEAQLDKGKGPVATVLVQKGVLHVGDAIAAGSAHGRVRAMMDDKGRRVKEAGPSTPVEILGLGDVPNAGEVFVGCATEKEARSFAETFISQNKVKLLEDTKSKMSLDDLFTQIKEGNLKELNIVVKADVQGSVEALKQSLLKLSNEEVVIKIIHGGVGAINESDVSLASASNAIIIGFNVRPDATAKEIADREGVDLRLYRVIYNAIEDVEAAMKGMLDPIFEEKVLGHAEVRQTFKASGVGTIAGAYIQDGIFERNCTVRLTRDGIVLFDGPLASLKRFKDDVKEVRAGYECGFVFENFNDIQEGDLAEAYKMVEVERK